MARSGRQMIKAAEDAGETVSDAISTRIAALQGEVSALTKAVGDYGGHELNELQHNAAALAKDMQRHGKHMVRQVEREARAAGRAVQENPVPVVVALGAIALMAALVFRRD